jgi:hypothetical protein
MGSIWTDTEAVVTFAIIAKNEASSSLTLNEGHVCLHGEIAQEEPWQELIMNVCFP